MKARAHVFVSGRVQGVFFRSTVAQEAQLRGVKGWTRNLPDGKVEAVFEGDREAVEAMIAFCRRGPRGARVTKVHVQWETYTGIYENFEVR